MYLILLLLIALSAFFSASETAVSTLNKIRLQKRAEDGDNRAKSALYLANNFDKALTTILIGNNIVNIGASSIATVLAVNMFGTSGAAIATGLMTLIILTFGEILPKCIAKEHSETFIISIAKILIFLIKIIYPFVILFIKLKQLVLKLLGENKHEPSVTEQELKYIIESIEGEGVLEKQESELVCSSLEFDEKTVQEILTPRVDIITVDIEDPIEKNTEIILKERYSRIPVCKGCTDKIIGTLHTRDFLEAIIKDEPLNIKKMMQPPFFVYKTKRLSSLLADFKRNKMHIAIVADDYGGTLGIVTMEDLLEQIVGDIWDEDEEIELDFVKINENTYEINGDMSIRDLFELFDLDFNEKDFTQSTMGGWALEVLAHIPFEGETFNYKNLKITVKEVNEQRIKKLTINLK